MKKRCLPLIFLCVLSLFCAAQNADFSVPDTICAGKPVIIYNVQPPSAISYKWSFCTGNTYYEPDGVNMSNPSQILNAPRYITIVQDSLDYYTFTTSTGNAKVLRCFYGSSLTSFPSNINDLGDFGILTNQVTGIQVMKDNGVWYGFVANGNILVRLNFGDSPGNVPGPPQVINLPDVVAASGLAIVRQDSIWVGFCTDFGGDKLFRLDFGQTLGDIPLVTNLGNTGQFHSPAGIALANENDIWYAFICNPGSSTLTRITFGSSLLNPAPAAATLANIIGLNQNAGITLINDCGGVTGFVTNCVVAADECVVHLVFPEGYGGAVSGYQIENNGILNKPYGISEVVRQGDTLYAFVANYGSSSLTRMFFPSCSGASQPFYTGPDPPPITYADPGKYNILLTVDKGMPEESSQCKGIVVMSKPAVWLGPDRTVCEGTDVVLNAGAGDSIYSWSTGATTPTITVDTSGTYWIHAVNFWNCEASDTINVTVNKAASAFIDTTICQGMTYWAQHAYQNTSGIYHDTLRLITGCDSIVTTDLHIEECQLLIWFPNAFTPNGDGLNDVFRPVGRDIIMYKLQIFDRWGALVFESGDLNTGWDGNVKGKVAGPDVYTYNVVFESKHFPGEAHRETGTFTLAR